MAYTGFHRSGQFGDRFVVAVQRNSLRREVRVQRDGEFAAGADVQGQTLFGDPAGDLAAQESLGGVVHVGSPTEGGGRLLAAGAEVVLVDDEQRGAVLPGQFGDGDSGDGGHPALVTSGVAGPHIRGQTQQFVSRLRARRAADLPGVLGVPGAGGVHVHILSGALTPRMASPLAMTWRAAWHNASRAVFRSVGCSSPWGRIRHAS